MEFKLGFKRDLGQQEFVPDALPYAVVGGAWEGSFDASPSLYTALNHIVPTSLQLKLLFLRVWTQQAGGAKFSIIQTNPTAIGATGTIEAYPVRGSVPQGVRDYPMLEASGEVVLRGSLVDPIHVLEGSVDFNVRLLPTPATGSRYGIVWWGVEKKQKR